MRNQKVIWRRSLPALCAKLSNQSLCKNSQQCRCHQIRLYTHVGETGTYTYDAFGRLKESYTNGHKTTYTYDNAGNRTNRAIVTGGLSTAVDVAVDLSVVPVGGTTVYHKLTYTLMASNFSGVAASGLSMVFTPPANLSLLATTGGGWSCSGTVTVTCTLATLAANTDSAAVTLDYRPTAANASAVATVELTSSSTDIQPTNNTDSVTSVILSSGSTTDVDGDGMDDAWEVANGLDPTNGDDGSLDPDGDTWSNLTEFLNRTNPNNVDTDGDGLNDNVDPNPTFNPAWIVPILQMMQ